MNYKKPSDRILIICIIFYFAFRFITPMLNRYFGLGRSYYDYGVIVSFILTGLLIHIYRFELKRFNIDTFSIILIFILRPICSLIEYSWGLSRITAFPRSGGIVLVITSLVFIILHLSWKGNEKGTTSFESIGMRLRYGMISGILISIILIIPNAFRFSIIKEVIVEPSTLYSIIENILFQGGYAASYEEPFFRGFLWGYLIKKGYKERTTLFIQAALFTVAHYYYIPDKIISFIVVVPICAISLGLIVRRTKSISSSIIAHSIINGYNKQFFDMIIGAYEALNVAF